MNVILKWLVRLFAVVAVLTSAAGLMGWYLATQSIPDYDAEFTMQGLDGPVQITRDANAVPHIRAESDADAFFALGLVHAQDRLWQMELTRRAAQGRMSALLGERTVELDLLVKTLDLYGYASRAVRYQTDETKAALQAYSAGVNAWISQVNEDAMGRGAPEFFVFGAELSPWTPADSIAVLKLMALRLSSAARNEVRRALVQLALPAERVADILPDYPVGAQITPKRPTGILPGANRAELPEALRSMPMRGPGTMDELLVALGSPAPPELAGASNAWAVDGTRTSSGRPLMANDPHLWLSAPSVWYLADVQGAGLSVIGGTLPGAPAVLVGRNRSMGWGLTTANVDDQDLYVEQVNPDNPDEYLLPDGTWTPFQTRDIRIEIDGKTSLTRTVRRTRHGPVLTGEQFGADRVTPDGFVTALAWTALEDEDLSMTAVMEIMYAGSVEAAVGSAGKVQAPAQNVVMADSDGVALVVAGKVPLRGPRSLSLGRVPSAGANAGNDWQGYMDPENAPQAVRPEQGAVANANNRTADAAYPRHLSFDWARPYRIQRLDKELTARAFHSLDGFVALQNDAISEMARSVLPLIAQDLWWRDGTPVIEDDTRRRALELLGVWNGEMNQHAPEPLIFMEWMRALTRRLALDELGDLYDDFQGPRPLFVERVFRDVDGAGIWCDVNKTPEKETCAQVAELAFDDALARLTRDYGDGVDGWRWGAAHVAIHRHTPFGYLEPLGILFNIQQETAGGNHTLLRGQSSGVGKRPFYNVHAAGLRVVYDFADPDRSMMIIATGQSGHPFSQHYDNLSELWVRGDMIPMSMDDKDARAGALGVTMLRPTEP
ncbi:MAG: penicillin acylase family protein [Pseudomonadota bacterium]